MSSHFTFPFTIPFAHNLCLKVIYLLGLKDKIRFANKATRARRYVFDPEAQQLEEMPTSLLHVLRFAIKHGLPAAMLRDLSFAFTKMASALFADNSAGHVLEGGSFATVHEFFRSHFSPHFARRFASALVHGIFSGSSQQLLLKYAFPALWQSQVAYDSVLVGALLDPYLKLAQCYDEAPTVNLALSPADQSAFEPTLKRAQRERVASLEGGLSTLTTRLHEHVRKEQVEIYLRTKVMHVVRKGDRVDVMTETEAAAETSEPRRTTFTATAVASTLPPPALTAVLKASLPSLELTAPQQRRAQAAIARLHSITSLSLAVVTVVYEGRQFTQLVNKVDAQPGFGFLMPEGPARGLILGVVYDSCVFPELAGEETGVFTIMLGGADPTFQQKVEGATTAELETWALAALSQHLGVVEEATSVHVTKWMQAIPQFDAAYSRARSGLQQLLRTHMPWLFVTGKAFGTGKPHRTRSYA
jgi:oxygen-dependent protoporphyrinogen oxidase